LKFRRLKSLVLWNSLLTDDGLVRLSELPNLELLDVRFSPSLTQAGIDRFQKRKLNCKVAFEQSVHPGHATTGSDDELESAASKDANPAVGSLPDDFSAVLEDDRQIRFVGVTRNTQPANDGWRPDGRPIGEVGYWPSTILVQKNSISRFDENGSHAEPDSSAVDFLFEFRGLKESPSLYFDLPTTQSAWSQDPLKDTYQIRVPGLLRHELATDANRKPPNDIVRVGLTDAAWGKWLQISITGEVLNPVTLEDLYASSYEQIQIRGVESFESSPDKLALVLRQPENRSSLYDFQIRGIDADDKHQWVLQWQGVGVSGTGLKESRWGLATPEAKRAVRYEYRLRPYRHVVIFERISLEPGRNTVVKVRIEVPAGVSPVKTP
jgi:hypothetical protein